MALPYDGDVKCFIQGFQYNQQKDSFYQMMIKTFEDNDKLQEAFLCSKQIIDQKGSSEIYYNHAVKGLLASWDFESAKKLAEEGLSKYGNS